MPGTTLLTEERKEPFAAGGRSGLPQLTLLHKDPTQRYPNATDLSQAGADTATVEAAEDLLVQRCMRRLGMGWKVIPRIAGDDAPNRRRYGIIELAIAERFGYHVPPDTSGAAQRQELDNTREKTLAPREHQAAYGSDGLSGCWGQAHSRLLQRAPQADEVLLRRLVTEAYENSRRDDKVDQVVRSWRACMENKGLHYKDPISAAGDKRWGRSPRPSRAELGTAVADVRCKTETGLVAAWHKIETRIQWDAIRTHPQLFHHLKEAKTGQLTAARQALAALAQGDNSGSPRPTQNWAQNLR
ncbi:hypothetical protein [Streptomyces milbemycinicus]|uniref:Uncharacterized protein n=1 Tax=Streptomyces milbemycinicus TaxID=476552 RepID=A0ABW8M4G3_9ACTN